MNGILQTASLAERFEHLLAVISSQRFLRMEGLGNEVPFFIAPFRASDAVDMEKIQLQLVRKLKQKGVRVLEINLYDLVREIMQAEGDWDYWLQHEAETDKEEMRKEFMNITDAENYLIPAIAEKMQDADFEVMFLCGVGEVYPYVRSHNVLNNLQKVAKDNPTVMFFPGEYTHSLEGGASLELFGRLRHDKYYRAFNIFEREI